MMPTEETTQSANWPDELIDLLERQESVLSKLHELAKYQGSLIEKGRTEPLLGLLTQRQTLIDEYTAMHGETTSKTEDLERRLQGIESSKKERIQTLIDEIRHCLSEIMKHDQEDQESLGKARDKIRDELALQGAATQARNAYTKGGAPASRFADRQG
ncbi:MAG: flagellar export chaperone FlgN [Planctomycetota bacterium]|nr:flagellar export chaperone FlgN [Planctomycetota bacterium]